MSRVGLTNSQRWGIKLSAVIRLFSPLRVLFFIYLFERPSHREGQRQRAPPPVASSCPKMPAMTKDGPNQSQESGMYSGSLTWVQRSRIESFLVIFQRTLS